MFGVSFTELLVVVVVGLVVLGPEKLPAVLGTLGRFIGKLRRFTTEMRAQSGIDDLLRQEGISGGLSELRGMLRTDLRSLRYPLADPAPRSADPYSPVTALDESRERPVEGPDAYGAIAEDLLPEPSPQLEASNQMAPLQPPAQQATKPVRPTEPKDPAV